MNENTKKDLQSAAFERLLNHLRERNDVLNIELLDGRIDLIVDKIYHKKKNND